jgi:hypothetical protein
VDRAAAADRRATTIAGTVAIAASFTLGGAGLVLDRVKVPDADVRRLFAVLLCVTTVFFVLSAIYALRALVGTRGWHWADPHQLDQGVPENVDEAVPHRLGLRAVS